MPWRCWRRRGANCIIAPVSRSLPLLLLGPIAFAACGEAARPQDSSGTWRIVERSPSDAAAIAAAAKRHPPVAALVAFDAGASAAARQAIAADPLLRDARLFGVGAPAATAPSPRETLVVEATAGEAALEMALLACHGLAVPPRVHVGTRIVDAANAAAGGVMRPAPGDLALVMLRREHAAVLTTRPDTDVVFPIAFVQWRADAWHDRVHDEFVAVAKRYAQVVLTVYKADGDTSRFTSAMQQCFDANVRAIVIAADDWRALAPLAAAADERRIARLGIDPQGAAAHVTCSLGADQEVLGRALGEAVKAQQPGGGALIEVGGGATASARQAGFASALGLQAK